MKNKKLYTMKEQLEFAQLSGDFNAMHVDEAAARRHMFGRPVVHGIHILLSALDWYLGRGKGISAIEELRSFFKMPLPVGEEAAFELRKEDNESCSIDVIEDVHLAADIKFKWKKARESYPDEFRKGLFEEEKIKELSIAEITGAKGELELAFDKKSAETLFPNVYRHIPPIQIAEILSTTRLVGMKCPGTNSLYSDLNVAHVQAAAARTSMAYAVKGFDERFNKAVIDIEGPTLKGTVGAFVRPKPKDQASFTDVQKAVTKDEFKGQKALIIGASRGLGEVTAKLLAAGGAKVMLTYFRGKDDADAVVKEIKAGGGEAESIAFNIFSPDETDLELLRDHAPTHVYYFATPYIAPGGKNFSEKIFKRFSDYYVTGFSNTVDLLVKEFPSIKHIFYPSSVFIDELPGSFMEYVEAKKKGEELCIDIEQSKKIAVYCPRLPKMTTDQTLSLYGDGGAEDPVHIMVKYAREFNKKQDQKG
ncbi:SDR family NAD(P)-dependent oxidoreductase [Spirochaetota bacterium]